MKITVSKIPPEGLEQRLRLSSTALPRLAEALDPGGADLDARLRLKRRRDVVQIEGTLAGRLEVPCQWCLVPVGIDVQEPVSLTLAHDRDPARPGHDVQLNPGDLDVSFYEGDEIDLVQVVEDEALLLVPQAVCEEDARGRCTHCGKRPEELYGSRGDRGEDHPFAQLKQWLPPRR
ncbi:MAG: DUF177 domain-containing protein [Candidatus Lambdaproteobacteria bacterium]|nr:DUF177 domain-containing protein [Candidatus Lambdaproteobacteria bacterium]